MDKRKIGILHIDSILNLIILSLRNMEVLNFTSTKWVFMLKSAEKWLCNTRKYKTVVGGAILNYSFILNFWKKDTPTIFFLWNVVFKSKISNGLDATWLNYEVQFLKIHILFFLWSRLPKYVIRSTLNLKAHEMTIAFPLFPISSMGTISFEHLPNLCLWSGSPTSSVNIMTEVFGFPFY
jgi:hypothetical protein